MLRSKNEEIEKKIAARSHFLDVLRSHVYGARFSKYMDGEFAPRANPRTARLVALRDSILNGYVSVAISLFKDVEKHDDPITNDNSLVIQINEDVHTLSLEGFLKKYFGNKEGRKFKGFAERHLYEKIIDPQHKGLFAPDKKNKYTLEEYIQIEMHAANPKLTDPELQEELRWLNDKFSGRYTPVAKPRKALIDSLEELQPVFNIWTCLSKGSQYQHTLDTWAPEDPDFEEDFKVFVKNRLFPSSDERLASLLGFSVQLINANVNNQKRNLYIFENK